MDQPRPGPPRPHLLVLSWHDCGRRFGFLGDTTAPTPRLDGLAAAGVTLTNVWSAAPLCGPSRGALLTGRSPAANGLLGQPQHGWSLHPDIPHLARRMRDLGHHTILAGFQHETRGSDAALAALGFTETLAHRRVSPPWFPPVPPAREIAAAVAARLAAHRPGDPPLYLQVGFWETHRPYRLPDYEPHPAPAAPWPAPWIADTPRARADDADLRGALAAANAAAGTILDALAACGLAEDTLVVFVSDHGLALPRAKLTCYDPGLESALLLRWPAGGLPAGGRVDRTVSNVDLVPTLLEILGVAPDHQLDGVSFADALHPRWRGAPERAVAFATLHFDGQDVRAARSRSHKVIRNFRKDFEFRVPVDLADGGHFVLQEAAGLRPVPPVECYDLAADPLETQPLPLAADPAFAALDAALWEHLARTGDPVLQGGVTTPIHAAQLAGRPPAPERTPCPCDAGSAPA